MNGGRGFARAFSPFPGAMRKGLQRTATAFGLLVAGLAGCVSAVRAEQAGDSRRGEIIFNAGNCTSCHTDVKNKGPLLAGGRRLATPFGVFVSPNITPDPTHGIGRWTDQDFIQAMRKGLSPQDRHYFPVFPYPAFTKLSDQDLLDMKAYIFSLPPVAQPSKPHEVGFPFNLRLGAAFWKWLYFKEGSLKDDPARDPLWNRGRYLVEAAGHCAECHTQRNLLGGLQRDMWLAGSADGAEGKSAPNLTPDKETGIGGWSDGDLRDFFKTGTMPDGDVVGGLMAEVVDNATSRLSDADVRAIIVYLRSLPPISHKARKP